MKNSPGNAWKAASGGVGDTLATFSLHPIAYAAIFTITSVQQFLIGPQSFKTPEQLTPGDQLLALCVIVGTVLILPFTIALLRYFAAGDLDHGYGFRRPFFRFLGWTVCLSILVVLFFLAFAIFIGIAAHLMPALGIGLAVTSFVFGLWISVRLATLFPSLALDEPPPVLSRAFRDTRGHFGFIFLAAALACLFVVPAVAALFGFYMVFGVPVPGAEPYGFGKRLIEAGVVGVFSTLTTVFCIAVVGRIFHTIRGNAAV